MSEIIDTLRVAVKYMQSEMGDDGTGDAKLNRALSLLSTPDALAWALLEEMAERDVEHRKATVYNGLILNYDTGDQFRHNGTIVNLSADGRVIVEGNACMPPNVNPKSAILCLARVIKEQEGRVRS